jgi:hypothetical protein
MPDQATCGKGLAENAALPAKLAEVIDAVGDNLSEHMTALDPRDPAARIERDAYATLLTKHRDAAVQLRAIAEEMAGYRDLPMAPHYPEVMRDQKLRRAFERLVALEKDLRAYFDDRIEREDAMLASARPARPARARAGLGAHRGSRRRSRTSLAAYPNRRAGSCPGRRVALARR